MKLFNTTPNPVFKVMLYFDAEYLINSLRYGHSYYGRRTGKRTQAKLSNGTSLNDLFKVMIFNIN